MPQVIPARVRQLKRPPHNRIPIHATIPFGVSQDWEVIQVGWTIQWDDGTTGIGGAPFSTRTEADTWLRSNPHRRSAKD
ncbi:hypothetical protein CcrC1_gp527c [Caulobacter phage C1]|nr:hypothetical protein CcrC1_gp034c [Caulobacter phage C1]UTU08261.1 hypothetical protein CcrC2_gp033c [Caulobacter phage C2]UTU08784.1 hypothetical protein CcrJ4_gp033c [Caulobacter phage J4]UTU09322.1 hypothetical protein CcrBL47_gp036c [Caulobacter phage BL47]UTU09896.1 hypothetical protein CcrRB23_gp034c [Caulobacter phage RB23]WGN96920.1 hypothetical protein [Bertelyvirus sp.]